MERLLTYYPFIVPVLALAYALLYHSTKAYLFIFGAVGSDIFNALLKIVFQPFCRSKWYPKQLLGTCMRPFGKTCGTFIDGRYGMPSGHSQFAAFVATYWLMYYYNVPTVAIPLVAVSLLVMYSRVYMTKCHTLQQVIIGAVIGVVLGYLYYRWCENFLKEEN